MPAVIKWAGSTPLGNASLQTFFAAARRYIITLEGIHEERQPLSSPCQCRRAFRAASAAPAPAGRHEDTHIRSCRSLIISFTLPLKRHEDLHFRHAHIHGLFLMMAVAVKISAMPRRPAFYWPSGVASRRARCSSHREHRTAKAAEYDTASTAHLKPPRGLAQDCLMTQPISCRGPTGFMRCHARLQSYCTPFCIRARSP